MPVPATPFTPQASPSAPGSPAAQSVQPSAASVGVNVTKTVPVQEPELVSPVGHPAPKRGRLRDSFELGEQELLSPTSEGLTSDMPADEAKKLEIKVPPVPHMCLTCASHVPHMCLTP